MLPPQQDRENPFSSKFRCSIKLRSEASKLRGTIALAKLLNMSTSDAKYMLTRTNVLSYKHFDCYRQIVLSLDETTEVQAALGEWFDIAFWGTDDVTIALPQLEADFSTHS